jgi:hypothetical protein
MSSYFFSAQRFCVALESLERSGLLRPGPRQNFSTTCSTVIEKRSYTVDTRPRASQASGTARPAGGPRG